MAWDKEFKQVQIALDSRIVLDLVTNVDGNKNLRFFSIVSQMSELVKPPLAGVDWTLLT